MRIQKTAAALLLVLLPSGRARVDAALSEEEGADELSAVALFQTENGETLHGSAAQFSTEANSDCFQVDSDGTAIVTRHKGRISNDYPDGVITFTAVIPQMSWRSCVNISPQPEGRHTDMGNI